MSWITPLGLPVIQPYRKPAIHVIRTILQSITLAVTDDALPVYAQKQVGWIWTAQLNKQLLQLKYLSMESIRSFNVQSFTAK